MYAEPPTSQGLNSQGFNSQDDIFMTKALEQARLAREEGEVPVGCAIIRGGILIGRGRNKTNATRNGTRHAEMVAVDQILDDNGGSVAAADFSSCTLYVTCEPCIMCAGALSLLGFKSVVYGCANDKFGGNGSIVPVHDLGCGRCSGDASLPVGASYPSRGGLKADDAVALLQDFYTSGNPNAPKPHRPLRSSSNRVLPHEESRSGPGTHPQKH